MSGMPPLLPRPVWDISARTGVTYFTPESAGGDRPGGGASAAAGAPIGARQPLSTSVQLPIDHGMDEADIVHHGEMRAVPDEDLQARIGEAAPAERMAPRHVGIAAGRKAGDRDVPGLLA